MYVKPWDVLTNLFPDIFLSFELLREQRLMSGRTFYRAEIGRV